MFEDIDDADRYASMLSATDFPSATSVHVETRMLLEFCREGGHLLGLVRNGTLVMPPEQSGGSVPLAHIQEALASTASA